MNRTEKQQEVDKLRHDFEAIRSAFLVDFRGMKVVDATELRRQVRKSRGNLKVIKNTLALLASKDLPLKALASHFTGPTAIAYTREDPVTLAKVLHTLAKDNPNLVIKAGYLEGTIIEGKRIQEVANLPSKLVLRGQVVGLLAS
ncbi:MAG TPA: 50S ribosomal protein L10, partial [Acidobacteriota bacterium]